MKGGGREENIGFTMFDVVLRKVLVGCELCAEVHSAGAGAGCTVAAIAGYRICWMAGWCGVAKSWCVDS